MIPPSLTLQTWDPDTAEKEGMKLEVKSESHGCHVLIKCRHKICQFLSFFFMLAVLLMLLKMILDGVFTKDVNTQQIKCMDMNQTLSPWKHTRMVVSSESYCPGIWVQPIWQLNTSMSDLMPTEIQLLEIDGVSVCDYYDVARTSYCNSDVSEVFTRTFADLYALTHQIEEKDVPATITSCYCLADNCDSCFRSNFAFVEATSYDYFPQLNNRTDCSKNHSWGTKSCIWSQPVNYSITLFTDGIANEINLFYNGNEIPIASTYETTFIYDFFAVCLPRVVIGIYLKSDNATKILWQSISLWYAIEFLGRIMVMFSTSF